MTYPGTFFAATTESETAGNCFVIMPFAREFTTVYNAISKALEAPDVSLRCRRADELFGGHEIMESVLQEIARAEIIVADLTARNPNVFYELGIAHMTKPAERVLLVTQRIKDVPFDLRPYRCIVYASSSAGLAKLKQDVATAARETAGYCYRFTLPRQGTHDTEPLFAGKDRCLYSVHLSELMPGKGFVKCRVRVVRHAIGEPDLVRLDGGLGLQENETRPLLGPDLPWSLRLDIADKAAASFSIIPNKVRPAKKPRQRAA